MSEDEYLENKEERKMAERKPLSSVELRLQRSPTNNDTEPVVDEEEKNKQGKRTGTGQPR